MQRIKTRAFAEDDWLSIETLYSEAFPDEDLVPLVRQLLHGHFGTLSLVGVADADLVGHILFTPCTVAEFLRNVVLLAPLAVTPARQRTGIGRTLVEEGLQCLAHAGTAWAYVLGDPAYYGRLGFVAETSVAPPYPLPTEWLGAWQSRCLDPSASPSDGTLSVPEPLRREALWLP